MQNELVIKCDGILVGNRHVYANLILKRSEVQHPHHARALDRNAIKKAVVEFFAKRVQKGMDCIDVIASIGTYKVEVGNIAKNFKN